MLIRQEKPVTSTGVYVHIPYCASKCPYCDFNSIPVRDAPERRYADCVIKELQHSVSRRGISCPSPLETVYFGGGTPTIFSPAPIARIIKAIKEAIRPSADMEITIEANPETVSPEKLAGYREAGVNRISIGVQSFDDEMLKTLGRTHRSKKAEEAFRYARGAGFDNIGIDLMFALPGQGLNNWKVALEKAVELGAEHVSLYGLTIESGTPFYARYKLMPGEALATEDEYAEMFTAAAEALKKAGYVHYEISNFGLPGRLSRHNQRYWLGLDTIGLGAGAHSYFSSPPWGLRRWNERKPEKYMTLVETAGTAAEGAETLTKTQAMIECAMLSLRLLDKGLDSGAFKGRFGVFPEEAFKNIEMLEQGGLLKASQGALKLTPKGVLLSDEVFLSLSKTLLKPS